MFSNIRWFKLFRSSISKWFSAILVSSLLLLSPTSIGSIKPVISAPSSNLLPDAFVGVWKGSAVQVNPGAQWTISLALTNGGLSTVVGTAGFPSVGCGAQLTYLDIQGNSVELLEKIIYGNCMDAGTITLTPNLDGSLDYSWRSSTGTTTAAGSVTKENQGQTDLSNFYEGVWVGSAVQVNPNVQWPILMTLTVGDLGKIVGIAGFAPYQCGAELSLTSVNSGFVKLLEDVIYGNCWDLGTITLTPQPDGSLKYQWLSPDNQSSALGSVKRVSSANAFLPTNDGYVFNSQGRPDTTWSEFKQTFSNSSLEFPIGIPKLDALFFYLTTYKKVFDTGVCFGMASTALAYYQDPTLIPGGALKTNDISNPNVAWPTIELYHGRQFSKAVQNYLTNIKNSYPGVDAIYNQIRTQLPTHLNDPFILVITPGLTNSIPQSKIFMHALIPYRIEEQYGTWGKVYVYDPNHPDDLNKIFNFDFSSSTHSFDYDMGTVKSSTGGYHVKSSDGWIIELLPVSQLMTDDAKVFADDFFASMIGDGEILHTNSLGQSIGYQQGVFTSTIPNADLLNNWFSFSNTTNSFGVVLPINKYQVTITSSGSYEYTAASIANSVDVKVVAPPVNSNLLSAVETVHLQIGSPGSASFTSGDATGRTLSMKIIGGSETTEREYAIANISTSGQTSLSAQVNTSGISIQTSGISSTFDLSIQGQEGGLSGLFIHKGIPISPGSVLTIDAPHIGKLSTITVTTSKGEIWVFGNQANQVYLPIIRQ